MSGRLQKPPLGFVEERTSAVTVRVTVKPLEDEAKARRLAEILADLIDLPAPEQGR